VASNQIKDAYKNEPLQRRNSTAKLRKISLSLCKQKKITYSLSEACGYSNQATGKILSIHYNTVARYIKTYREKGIESPGQTHLNLLGFSKDNRYSNRHPVFYLDASFARLFILNGLSAIRLSRENSEPHSHPAYGIDPLRKRHPTAGAVCSLFPGENGCLSLLLPHRLRCL
jgi:hypothetical protein